MFAKSHFMITLNWLGNHCLNSVHGELDVADPINNVIIL